MATQSEAIMELRRRGLLPVEQSEAVMELQRRGLFDVQPKITTGLGVQPDVEELLKYKSEKLDPGFFDFVTGKSKQTRATEQLPELGSGGLLFGEDKGKVAVVASVLSTTTNPKEIGEILQNNFENIVIREDEKGNLLAANNTTGAQVVINKPGLSKLDIMQGLGLGALFTPAGAISGVVKKLLPKAVLAAVTTGATQAGIETAQEAVGGEFEKEEVAIATLAGPLAEIAGAGISTLKKAVTTKVPTEMKQVTEIGKVLSTDIKQPDTFVGKTLQKVVERIPLVGTGSLRAQQQLSRIHAVDELAQDLVINVDTQLGKKIIDSAGRQFKKSQARASVIRSEAIQELDKLGELSATNAIKSVDDQITKIEARGKLSDPALIQNLKDIKSELTGNFSKLKDVRTLIFGMQQDVGAAKSVMKSGADIELSVVSGALSKDLDEIAKQIPAARSKWKASNKIFRDNISKAKDTELKRILTKGKLNPEIVESVIKSGKVSSMKRLYANLDDRGRQGVRQQIIKDALVKASRDGTINPTAFKTALDKSDQQIKTFFKGSELNRLKGLQKYLDITQRAQTESLDIASNQSVAILTGMGAVGAAMTNPWLLTIAPTVGAMGRIYESKPIRTLLIKLAAAKPASNLEKNLMDGLRLAIISQQQD